MTRRSHRDCLRSRRHCSSRASHCCRTRARSRRLRARSHRNTLRSHRTRHRRRSRTRTNSHSSRARRPSRRSRRRTSASSTSIASWCLSSSASCAHRSHIRRSRARSRRRLRNMSGRPNGKRRHFIATIRNRCARSSRLSSGLWSRSRSGLSASSRAQSDPYGCRLYRSGHSRTAYFSRSCSLARFTRLSYARSSSSRTDGHLTRPAPLLYKSSVLKKLSVANRYAFAMRGCESSRH